MILAEDDTEKLGGYQGKRKSGNGIGLLKKRAVAL
jgi:hypothetical protein